MPSSISESATRGRATPSPVAHPQATEGKAVALLTLLLAATVVYLPNQAQFRLETGVRGVNVVNLLVLLAGMVMLLSGRPKSEPVPMKLPFWLMILSVTWSLVLALVGDASAWVEDLTVYKNAVFYPMLYLLFFFAVRDMKRVRMLLFLSLFVLFIASWMGLRQAMSYGIGTFNDAKRVSAPFGWEIFDANRAAVFFCIYLQFVGAVAVMMKSQPVLRLVCAALFALGVFVVFHTYSRQALVILAALVFLLALRRHFMLALLAAVVLFNYPLWVPDSVVERVQMTKVDPLAMPVRKAPSLDPLAALNQPFAAPPTAPPRREGGGQDEPDDPQQYDGSTESRFTMWAGAWEIIQRNPMGIGLNRFKREIGAYVPPDLAGKDAHNVFVLVATEAGLMAPLVLVMVLVALMLQGQRLARMADDDEARTLGSGFVLATLAVVLGNTFGSRFFDGDVMGNYWVIAALVARMTLLKQEERRQRQLPRQRHVPGRIGAAGSPAQMGFTDRGRSR